MIDQGFDGATRGIYLPAVECQQQQA